MRKAKPKEKREIKVNEPKEMHKMRDVHIPKELEDVFVFTACMLEMKACLEDHREIWRRHFKNGGYLKANYKIALGRMINLCDKLAQKYTAEGIQVTDFARMKIIKMIKNIHVEKTIRDKTKGSKKAITLEDDSFEESHEFYSTIIAAWTFSMLLFSKLHQFIKREKIQKEAKELSDKVVMFMGMIDRDIVLRAEDVPSKSFRRKHLKKIPEQNLKAIHKKLREQGYLCG